MDDSFSVSYRNRRVEALPCEAFGSPVFIFFLKFKTSYNMYASYVSYSKVAKNENHDLR